MRNLYFLLALILIISFEAAPLSAQGVFDRMKQKAKDKIDQRVDSKIDKAMEKTLDDAEKAGKDDKPAQTEKDKKEKPPQTGSVRSSSDSQPVVRSYQNYDFVPGDKIIFEDN